LKTYAGIPARGQARKKLSRKHGRPTANG
jgi:hypothetical protein